LSEKIKDPLGFNEEHVEGEFHTMFEISAFRLDEIEIPNQRAIEIDQQLERWRKKGYPQEPRRTTVVGIGKSFYKR
jgi:hypothetical protein